MSEDRTRCRHPIGYHGLEDPICETTMGDGYCGCKGYRTKAQAEALKNARLSLAPAVTEVKASVVKQLLEAFE